MTSGPSGGAKVSPAVVLRADWPWVLLCLLAAALYFLGLGSPYAPTNGDEMVYIHIARVTGESGHWLPLQSELVAMRNTKPPLLIWQGLFAGDWGHHWNLFALRLPSVLYTLATCGFIFYFTRQLGQRTRDAWLACALYLLFFSSFRYCRVYLTSAPETFWMALPMWWLLHLRLKQQDHQQHSSVRAQLDWRTFTVFGLAIGIGAAYKSFALLAPAGAAMWFAWLAGERPLNWRATWRTTLHTTLGLGWSVLLGLGIFCLWFVLDPDPSAVWKEFVVGENAGKMTSAEGYWHAALYGTYPMWTQLLAYPVNAGLLAFQTIGFLGWCVFRFFRGDTKGSLTPAHKVLLAWLLVWLVVFALPTQRSERYVIAAMPALAIAMALCWERIARAWSILGLLIAAPALLMLGRIAWSTGSLAIDNSYWDLAAILVSALGLLAVLAGLGWTRWSHAAGLWACLAIYACFGLLVTPLSGPGNTWATDIKQSLQDKRVAVPNGFTGQFENYHFELPQSHIFPYDTDGRNTGELYPEMPGDARLARLLTEFDGVIWRQDQPGQTQPACVPECKVLAQRWHVRSRHKSGEVTLDNVWYPQQWLFNREWLVSGVKQP